MAVLSLPVCCETAFIALLLPEEPKRSGGTAATLPAAAPQKRRRLSPGASLITNSSVMVRFGCACKAQNRGVDESTRRGPLQLHHGVIDIGPHDLPLGKRWRPLHLGVAHFAPGPKPERNRAKAS